MRDKLENQLLAFFDRNPDEILTHDDAAVKFGVSRKQAEDVMRDLGHRKALGYRFVQAGKVRTKVYERAE